MQTDEAVGNVSLGQWLRLNRERTGVPLARLAEMAGVNAARLAEWEQGQRTPQPSALEAVARVLAQAVAPEGLASPACPACHIWLDERGIAWIDDTNTKVKEIVLEKQAAGLTPEEIQAEHSHLSLAQVYAAFAYYHDCREVVDAQIAQDCRYVEDMRRQAGESPFVTRMRAEGHLP